MMINKGQKKVINFYLVFIIVICFLLVPMEKIRYDKYEGLAFRPIFIDEIRDYTSENSFYSYGAVVDVGRLICILILVTIIGLYLFFFKYNEDNVDIYKQ